MGMGMGVGSGLGLGQGSTSTTEYRSECSDSSSEKLADLEETGERGVESFQRKRQSSRSARRNLLRRQGRVSASES